jgi:uncharacterized protein
VLIVVSPAKSLDYESPLPTRKYTVPAMLDRSQQLVDIMVTKGPEDISALMSISPALGELNHDRFQDWQLPLNRKTARPALVAFNGDVYDGMNARGTFSERDFSHAQKTLRILSGLYGVLKPLDLMLPYRLEMGTALANPSGKDLYAFWGDTITEAVQEAIDASPGAKVLVNLASQEYFGSVRPKKLNVPVIDVAFLDGAPGEEKIVSFFAKRARGAMAGWLIRERITTVGKLTSFNELGYAFDPARSTKTKLTFVRGPQ